MKFELEVVKFNVADVITASTDPNCPTNKEFGCPGDED